MAALAYDDSWSPFNRNNNFTTKTRQSINKQVMANTKECLVVIIDVREGANKNFKDKAIRCVADILKEKICAKRKDAITFVLMGTKRTSNIMNDKTGDEYLNLLQYKDEELPSWRLFCNFFKFVEEEVCNEVDWLDALILALEIQHEHEAKSKCPHRRILLFHNFDGSSTSFDGFDFVANSIVEKEIGVIVVSEKIGYKTNTETSRPEAVFVKNKSFSQDAALEDEEHALRLVNSNAMLCNFDEALLAAFRLSNSRPWCWQANLTIGSQISIAISGLIAIKDENSIIMKKCWGESDELPAREMRTYVKGVEQELDTDDMITGYMLGATPIAFDETVREMDDEEESRYRMGLKFLGFPKRSAIPEEYFCGDSLYWVVHRKNMVQSARKLDALVKVLQKTDRAVLCWKIFSEKHNNPKLVVLLPNESKQNRPATLSMVELTYHAQHHYWDFPLMTSKRTTCTQAQLDAVDELIDSMDLMLDESHEPRQFYENDLLSFNSLPHVFERNMMDLLEWKVLCEQSKDDEQFQKMLTEKKFVDAYWKVPELNEKASKEAAAKIRELFPLEKSTQLTRDNVNPVFKTLSASNVVPETKPAVTSPENNLSIESVGMKTPDDDFEKLIKHRVLTIQDKTKRDRQFHVYAAQMRNAIWHLIFELDTLDIQSVYDALSVYRTFCFDFNAFDDYNKWIGKVKLEVQSRKDLHRFWHEVIIQRNLGLCFIGQPTLEEQIKIDDFFNLNAAGGNDEADVSK